MGGFPKTDPAEPKLPYKGAGPAANLAAIHPARTELRLSSRSHYHAYLRHTISSRLTHRGIRANSTTRSLIDHRARLYGAFSLRSAITFSASGAGISA